MRSLLFLLALATMAAEPQRPVHEMRGLWVVRTALVSPESVDRVIDEAQAAGFNALFVQVRGRGDAFYRSRLEPRSVLLERQAPAFDPLARLIERARGRGLEVHAWINVLLSAHFAQPLPAGHVLARHPEWVMVPRSVAREALGARPQDLLRLVGKARGDGDVEGYYLSPAVPGVGAYLEEVVRELVRGYPVDGVHLDFIRFPSPDYDWSRPALASFAGVRGDEEPGAFPAPQSPRHSGSTAQRGGRSESNQGAPKARDLLEAPTRDPAAWNEHRRELLTALADRLSRAARAARPGVLISAAVVPDEALAIQHKYQSWPLWTSRGILDAVCPMAYTPDARLFREQTQRAVERVAGRQPVWVGVGSYRLSMSETIERIRAARGSGAAGVVLFSHESFSAFDLRRLREEVFARAPASSVNAAPSTTGRR